MDSLAMYTIDSDTKYCTAIFREPVCSNVCPCVVESINRRVTVILHVDLVITKLTRRLVNNKIRTIVGYLPTTYLR